MSRLLIDTIPFKMSKSQINESLKENNGRLIVEGVLQRAEAENQNGRIYPTEILRREVKKYIDTVYLDMGFRNKNNIATALDEIIASKLEEAQETGMYSNKDLADLLQMAHKMRMDEIKAQADAEKATTNIRTMNNVQINDGGLPFGQGNYGKLMDKLLNGET